MWYKSVLVIRGQFIFDTVILKAILINLFLVYKLFWHIIYHKNISDPNKFSCGPIGPQIFQTDLNITWIQRPYVIVLSKDVFPIVKTVLSIPAFLKEVQKRSEMKFCDRCIFENFPQFWLAYFYANLQIRVCNRCGWNRIRNMSAFEYSTTGMILESVEYKQFKLRLKSDSNRRKYLNWVNQELITWLPNVLITFKVGTA